MRGDPHAGFCESRGVRFPPATHLRLTTALPRLPRRRQTQVSGHRVQGRRSRSHATARRTVLDAVTASGTLGGEEDGHAAGSCLANGSHRSVTPGMGGRARRAGLPRLSPARGAPDAVPRSGAALMAAKAYRLLRAVLTTAVEEDKILPRNPCRVRGAGEEHAAERPVLTVAQVFELAERVGRRPIGNIRKLPGGGYRLRFRRNGEMRTSPEVYGTRADAERALWKMAEDGRADCNHDRRFRAMVMLATFASLRWGEVTALSRCDLDLQAATVRVRAAFTQRRSYSSAIILGPPKSRAGRRVVGIPKAIIPVLEQHMSEFVGPEPGALVFCGVQGGAWSR